jgi:hypothetical protein
VLEFRQQSTAASYRVKLDLENIEELFSLAAAADTGLTDSIRTAIAATLAFREKTRSPPLTKLTIRGSSFAFPSAVTSTTPSPSEEASLQVPQYTILVAGLLGMLSPRGQAAKNALISVNYDLLIEQALVALNVPFSYGFSPASVEQDKSARRLALSGSPEVELLKLHGSTNWAVGDDPDRIELFDTYESLGSRVARRRLFRRRGGSQLKDQSRRCGNARSHRLVKPHGSLSSGFRFLRRISTSSISWPRDCERTFRCERSLMLIRIARGSKSECMTYSVMSLADRVSGLCHTKHQSLSSMEHMMEPSTPSAEVCLTLFNKLITAHCDPREPAFFRSRYSQGHRACSRAEACDGRTAPQPFVDTFAQKHREPVESWARTPNEQSTRSS